MLTAKPSQVGYQYAINDTQSNSFLNGGYTSLSPQIFFEGRHTAKSIAARVTKDDLTDLEKAKSLAYWTFLHVRPQNAAPTSVIGDDYFNVLRRGWGYCDQMAHVYSTLATYAGVPSRQLQLFRKDYGSPHTLAESLIDGRWVVIATWRGFVPVDSDGNPITKEELANSPQMNLFADLKPSDFLDAVPFYSYPYAPITTVLDRALNRIMRAFTPTTPTTPTTLDFKDLDLAKRANLNGDFEESKKIYLKILDSSASPRVKDQALFWLSVNLFDAGKFVESQQRFELHKDSFPKSPFFISSSRFLAEIALSMGETEEALSILKSMGSEQARVSAILVAEGKHPGLTR